MPERPYERFMRIVLSRSLGVPVEHVDDGSRPGHHDAEIRYPDGRVAAVEFTTVGDPDALTMDRFPTSLEVPDTPFWWTLRYPVRGVSWRELRQHVPTLVQWLDRLEIRDAADARSHLRGSPEWDWLERNDLSLRHFGPTKNGRRVDVLPDSFGGVVDVNYLGLLPWIDGLQREHWWAENVAKLERSGRAELHLALRAHESGLPFGILSALMDGRQILGEEPRKMEPLTDFWIVAHYGRSAAHWSRGRGWTVHDYGTPGDSEADKKNADALRKILDAADRAAHDE